MKSKVENHKKDLTVVQQLRQVRDKINHEIKELPPNALMEYLKNQKTLNAADVWHREEKNA
jgi:hypothetical protein